MKTVVSQSCFLHEVWLFAVCEVCVSVHTCVGVGVGCGWVECVLLLVEGWKGLSLNK